MEANVRCCSNIYAIQLVAKKQFMREHHTMSKACGMPEVQRPLLRLEVDSRVIHMSVFCKADVDEHGEAPVHTHAN